MRDFHARFARLSHRLAVVAAVSVAVLPVQARAESLTDVVPVALEPTTTVTVVPPYGYYAPPIRERLSASEMRVVARLQRIATTWRSPEQPGRTIRWHIEDSAAASPTLLLARRAMSSARTMLAWDGAATRDVVDVVVGRTQRYLNRTVASLGCDADLTRTDGRWIMGAIVCGGSTIVINLTGYLFLRRSDQPITDSLERLREPSLADTWYLIIDRNKRSLAHEWVHAARYSPGLTLATRSEPAWFREGLAETVSGLAAVRSTGGRLSYLEHHVISLRRFSRWLDRCRAPMSQYRADSAALGGCEYSSGAAAVEILLADHGGLERVISLYRTAAATGDWQTAFESVYGMPLGRFEAKADRYISYMRAADGA